MFSGRELQGRIRAPVAVLEDLGGQMEKREAD